jgi:uncharacterized protein
MRRTRAHVDLKALEPLLENIVARWQPLQVWLFGSRARGSATQESDWDLLVVVPDDASDIEMDQVSCWKLARSCGIRADILAYRESDFLAFRSTLNTIPNEVATDGILIRER